LSVLLCDLDTIQELNRTYRGKDEPTDVLSFSQREGHGPAGNGPPGNDLLRPESLGDIVACLPIVEDQAHRFGCSPDQELRRVLTHGVLHLIGMNHETNQPEEGMLALQERILRALEPAELSW
jgi:probable rRNA maturation factor